MKMNLMPLTRVTLSLSRLDHNMKLLRDLAGGRPLWPAVKANGYGHGAVEVARRLVETGSTTICVAHAAEAAELEAAGVETRFIILSPDLGGAAPEMAARGWEPVVCSLPQLEALSREGERQKKTLRIHLKTDTGMGRVGFPEKEAVSAVRRALSLEGVSVASVMTHFPRADEEDKSYSLSQLERFLRIRDELKPLGIPLFHAANSAAIFDLPGSHLDLCRPGISIYGLKPSPTVVNPRTAELKPVLTWSTRITQLKEVPAGAGLSYGHTFVTTVPSLIATLPVGYGDGLMRLLSGKMDVLIGGVRCPQVGRICMDQCVVDVTALRGRVKQGDEAVLVGAQGTEEITADEMAAAIGTINYEITTQIARRVPRLVVN